MKSLNKYFDAVKNHRELMDTEELNELLELGLEAESNKDRNYNYLKIAASILFILSAGVAGWLGLKDKETKAENIVQDVPEYSLVSLVRSLKNETAPSVKVLTNSVRGIPEEFTSYLMPEEGALKKLGISLHEDYVRYEGNVDFAGFLRFTIGERQSVQVSDNKRHRVPVYDFYPMFISDADGYRGVNFSFDEEPDDKMEDGFFQRTMNELVPILVKVPQRPRTVVFWFSPSPSLFEILDDNAERSAARKENLKNLQKDVPADKKTERFEIYPNPASGPVQIEAEFNNETASVHLVNMKGSIVRSILPKQKVDGTAVLKLDVSSVKPGIYLIVMNSDKKGKLVRRLIVSRK